MKAPEWNDSLLVEHRDSMDSSGGRDAYDLLTRAAQELTAYACAPAWQGDVRIFKYTDPASGERPFAFIVNRGDLLFYVRKPGFVRVPGGFHALKSQFASARKNPAGEWTVRITGAADAQALLGVVFGSEGNPRADWTENEIRILVADYFDMLRMERQGLPYSKAVHNAALQGQLPGRSRGSIEYKHQNVSGVLYDENFPFLDGYKPARNYQRRLLPPIVLELLNSGNAAVTAIEQAADAVIKPVEEHLDFSLCEVPTPPLGVPTARTASSRLRKARRYDYAARDANNRKLGRAGEEFILQREQWYLQSVGREDLSHRLEWVSDTRGDGLGYDLVSYSPETEKEIYIEVKTTNCGERFPFYVTHSEVEVAEELGDQYRLARVFNFSTRPQFYSVVGNLWDGFHLSPRLFEARR